MANAFDTSVQRSNVKSQFLQSVSVLALNRSLGEGGLEKTWERKDKNGKKRKEMAERFRRNVGILSVHGCFMSSVTAPCGALTHTQAASDGSHAVWGYCGAREMRSLACLRKR